MNVFDYFFEKTFNLSKPFIIGSETITFSDLYNSSLQLAAYLRNEIGEKKKVLLVSVNNLFFIKAYLAIIKSGNICIPLDPGIEKENFSYITSITKPDLIFLTKDIRRKLLIGNLKCLMPEDIQVLGNSPLDTFSKEISNSNECCEIIFTSGSTGRPKGVMISHKNLIANTTSILEYLELRQNDRMLVVLPFFYCYGLSLLHTHLRVGGSLVLNNSFIFIGKVIRDLKEYECTGFAGVPSHYQILLRKSDTFRKTVFPALKYVTQAGGGLATPFIDEFRESFPSVKFFVMYGQTEATARLSFLPPEFLESKNGSIGKGIPGVELRMVNEKGEDVNPGENGELIARGGNIMIGYFQDETNGGSVIKDGWLYTGDLGYVDNDGFIFLNARKSDLIKIGGKRVSLKEIETVILQLPCVIDCSLQRVPDSFSGESLIAAILTNSKLTEDKLREEIKRHCSKHLASYKIPKTIIFDTDMKISASGKKVLKEGKSNT
jgi:long-chain acyl-CoA synthetase